MLYLLVKESTNKYTIYNPELFGNETWGMPSQISLEKKRKYWYIINWVAGNDYIEDRIESKRLKVVLETSNLQKVLSYIIKETNNNQVVISSILKQAQELYYEQIEFENWAKNRK